MPKSRAMGVQKNDKFLKAFEPRRFKPFAQDTLSVSACVGGGQITLKQENV